MKIVLYRLILLAFVSAKPALAAEFDEGLAVEILRGETLQAAWQLAQSNPEIASRYLRAAIEQRLVMEAARLGLEERADVQDALQRARRQVLVQALREHHNRGVTPPSEADTIPYFYTNAKDYKLAEAFRMVAVEWPTITPEHADRVAKMVKAGKGSTDALVAVNGKLASSGAEQEWLNERNVTPPVWAKLKTLKDGQQSLVQTNQSLIVFSRVEYRPERPAKYEEAKDSVRRSLYAQRKDKAWREYVEEKAEEARE